MDISSLENVDADRIVEEKKRNPDYNRFKLLYDDPSGLGGKNEGAFKRLYEFESDEARQDNKFAPLDHGGSARSRNESGATDGTDEDAKKSSDKTGGFSAVDSEHPTVSEKTGEDKARPEAGEKETAVPDKSRDQAVSDNAYNKGFEEGKKQGYDKGFEQGKTDGFEQGFEKGRSEGFEKGETEAAEQMEQKAAEKIETLEGMIQKLDTCYEDLLHANEEKIISLVQQITEKVVFAKVEADRTVMKNTVLDALEKLAAPEEIVLLVSGHDYEYIEMVKEDFFEAVKSLKSVAVKSDPSIKPGGCRIESGKGVIQTDPEEKLKKVFDSVKEVAGS